jgi:hypothetical protein
MISKSWSTSKKRAAIYRQAGDLAEFCLQLFPLVVAHSDDYGRLDADPETVKLVCDPGCPRPVEDFTAALRWFNAIGLVRLYTVDGDAWLQIEKFDEHQPGLLSKRTVAKNPAPPSDTELPEFISDSGLTKPNLTQPNLTTSQTSAPTAADIVDLWNRLVTPPIPQVTKLTPGRAAKINARLKAYRDLALWQTVITWISQQEWCRASGVGDHPNWTATLDWLCKSDDQIQKYIERAQMDTQRLPPRAVRVPGCRHTPPCTDAAAHTTRDMADRRQVAS